MFDLHERVYQVFDAPLFVISECPALSRHAHTFLANLENARRQPVARVTLLQTGRGDGPKGVQLCCPELRWAETADTPSRAWVAFRRLLLRFILDAERPDALFHGSTVCDGAGNAATVIGISGAGKTTATVGLARAGLTLVADEYTAVGLENRKIRSFPSGVTVTDATVRMFPELRPLLHEDCRFRDANGVQSTVNLSRLCAVAEPDTFVEPRCFFILFPAFGEKTRIEACSHGEAVWFLHDGLYPRRPRPPWAKANMHEYHRRLFGLVDHLARRIRVYKVFNGDIHDTVAVMSEALRGEEPALRATAVAVLAPA